MTGRKMLQKQSHTCISFFFYVWTKKLIWIRKTSSRSTLFSWLWRLWSSQNTHHVLIERLFRYYRPDLVASDVFDGILHQSKYCTTHAMLQFGEVAQRRFQNVLGEQKRVFNFLLISTVIVSWRAVTIKSFASSRGFWFHLFLLNSVTVAARASQLPVLGIVSQAFFFVVPISTFAATSLQVNTLCSFAHHFMRWGLKWRHYCAVSEQVNQLIFFKDIFD